MPNAETGTLAPSLPPEIKDIGRLSLLVAGVGEPSNGTRETPYWSTELAVLIPIETLRERVVSFNSEYDFIKGANPENFDSKDINNRNERLEFLKVIFKQYEKGCAKILPNVEAYIDSIASGEYSDAEKALHRSEVEAYLTYWVEYGNALRDLAFGLEISTSFEGNFGDHMAVQPISSRLLKEEVGALNNPGAGIAMTEGLGGVIGILRQASKPIHGKNGITEGYEAVPLRQKEKTRLFGEPGAVIAELLDGKVGEAECFRPIADRIIERWLGFNSSYMTKEAEELAHMCVRGQSGEIDGVAITDIKKMLECHGFEIELAGRGSGNTYYVIRYGQRKSWYSDGYKQRLDGRQHASNISRGVSRDTSTSSTGVGVMRTRNDRKRLSTNSQPNPYGEFDTASYAESKAKISWAIDTLKYIVENSTVDDRQRDEYMCDYLQQALLFTVQNKGLKLGDEDEMQQPMKPTEYSKIADYIISRSQEISGLFNSALPFLGELLVTNNNIQLYLGVIAKYSTEIVAAEQNEAIG